MPFFIQYKTIFILPRLVLQPATNIFLLELGMEIMKYTLENIFNLSYYGVNNITTQYNTTFVHRRYIIHVLFVRIRLLCRECM
jgi:hypothetical protein